MKAELTASALGLPLLRLTLESDEERAFFGGNAREMLGVVLGPVIASGEPNSVESLDLIVEPDLSSPSAAREAWKREAIRRHKLVRR